MIATAAGILLVTTAANAQRASFDCLQGARLIEWLICSDPVLIRLDGALGEAYAAYRRSLAADEARQALLRDQRAWLQRRLTECGIPTSGDRLSLPQRWQAAPCLAQMYNDRLAALGQPQEAAFQPEEITKAEDFVHPLCLELALGQPTSQDDAVDLMSVSVPVKASKATSTSPSKQIRKACVPRKEQALGFERGSATASLVACLTAVSSPRWTTPAAAQATSRRSWRSAGRLGAING